MTRQLAVTARRIRALHAFTYEVVDTAHRLCVSNACLKRFGATKLHRGDESNSSRYDLLRRSVIDSKQITKQKAIDIYGSSGASTQNIYIQLMNK